MNPSPPPLVHVPDFSAMAPWYRALEVVALGGSLERARFCYLERLRDCRSILVLGEGDGRFVKRLASVASAARVLCVDGSAGMIANAVARLTAAERSRISFAHADLRDFVPPETGYDVVVTLFVLDCFSTAEVAALVERLMPRLAPDAIWLLADFVLPASGWRRWRALVWLKVLYTSFHWLTGLGVTALPDSEAMLERAGWIERERREFQHGLLRTSVWRKKG